MPGDVQVLSDPQTAGNVMRGGEDAAKRGQAKRVIDCARSDHELNGCCTRKLL